MLSPASNTRCCNLVRLSLNHSRSSYSTHLPSEYIDRRYAYKIGSLKTLSEVLRTVRQSNGIADTTRFSARKQAQFPAFISRDPTTLNRSLLSLFKEYPADIVSKICYNLLVSNAVPNLKTYNILIRGFAILRRPTFAILIFKSLIEAGLTPNRYTFVALVTLFISSGNYLGFSQLLSTIRRHRFLHKISDPYINTCIVTGLLKFNKLRTAHYYQQNFERRGASPSIHVLTLQLRLSLQRGDPGGQGRNEVDAVLRHENIDKWAIYWAWKLSVKRDYYDMQKRLKELVQSRGLNEDTLWIRPHKKRGLKVRKSNKEPEASHPVVSDKTNLQGMGTLLHKLDESYHLLVPKCVMDKEARACVQPKTSSTPMPSCIREPTPSATKVDVCDTKPTPLLWKASVWSSILHHRAPQLKRRV